MLPFRKLPGNISFLPVAFVMVVSGLLRFAWDPGTQTLIHVVLIAALICTLSLVRFDQLRLPQALAAVFFLAALLSLPGAVEKAGVRNELLLLFDGIIIFFLASSFAPPERRAVLLIPVAIGLWYAVILFTYFLRDPARYLTGYYLPPEIIVNPNVLSGYLVAAFPLSFLWWGEKKKSPLVLSAVLFAAILLSRSRAGILISLLVLSIHVIRSSRLSFRYFAAVFLAAATVIAFLHYLKSPQASSFLDRLVWARSAAEMFLQHPLTGVGWGNFANLSLSFRSAVSMNTLYAHNLFLQVSAEAGILCLATLLLFIFSLFRNIARAGEAPAEKTPLALSLAAFLLDNLSNYTFYVPGTLFLFWLVAGCAAPSAMIPRSRPVIPVWLIAALIIVSGYAVSLPWRAQAHYRESLALLKQGQEDEALKALQRSIRIDPVPSPPHSTLAELFFRRYRERNDAGDLRRAVTAESEALRRNPANAGYWSDLSWLNWTSGEKDKAIEAMSRAVSLDPHNPRYRGALRSFRHRSTEHDQ